MIGQTLGHYSILKKLGEGGMGAVYLAEDSRLNRKIALKVLPKEMADEPERIRATLGRRETIFGDDIVQIMLDTFLDERRAYSFICNPYGVQFGVHHGR